MAFVEGIYVIAAEGGGLRLFVTLPVIQRLRETPEGPFEAGTWHSHRLNDLVLKIWEVCPPDMVPRLAECSLTRRGALSIPLEPRNTKWLEPWKFQMVKHLGSLHPAWAGSNTPTPETIKAFENYGR